ncbi:hypothetical protein F511_00880 [Dorcoceras hygrometricum]|nr:hypothetical protein F511_00880 [Dorcoceras hygrometricum]
MVQLMGSSHVDDFLEEEYGPLAKRSCSPASQSSQRSSINHGFPTPLSEYNPLDEPSPLGLRLRKTPSLIDLIQMRLSQGTAASTMLDPGVNAHSLAKTDVNGIAAYCANDKLKASNFPALLLRIGTWEYVSKYEGDLVAKCYFAKHKLVWEVLDGGLKSKIEIQWSDITALKAELPDNGPSGLTIVLARQPTFYRETNPQPRKHTLWQASADFTDGQAEKIRQHYLQCSPGVLNKHYEKLIQCDVHLCNLSRQPEIIMDSPYFDSQVSVNSEEVKSEECNETPAVAEGSPSVFQNVEPAAAVPIATFDVVQNHLVALPPPHVSKEVPSPISVMDAQVNERDIKFDESDSFVAKIWESPRVHGLPHSISISDLVNHIGNCISEQVTCGNLPSSKASQCQDMLENISHILLSDTQHATGLDEKSLMKKVNSLCCLLQDPAIAPNSQVRESHCEDIDHGRDISSELMNNSLHEDAKCKPTFEGNFKNGVDIYQGPSISRKDSLNDFLLHLPHIASLPKFLFGTYMEIGHCFLDGNADAVEFCPHESFYNVLAASTYVLQEGDRPSRSGSVTLFDVDADDRQLHLIQRLETSGIFDIKWSPGKGEGLGYPLLAQADADGWLKIHGLHSNGSEMRAIHLTEMCGKCISSSMCLCVNWNPSATSMIIGLSDGSVSVISLQDSELNILHKWKAHEFELWAACFDVHQPMLVYTGSDDCTFSCWDLRNDLSKLVFKNTKVHGMGICCIAKSPTDSNILLTGSYDEQLRIWDVRSTSEPVIESSIGLGGGVWRIKYHPSIAGLVLAACMHNGFAILKIKDDQARVVETYDKHSSLAYGADWQGGDSFVDGKRKSSAVATCSFYDRLVRVWTPEVDMFV